MSPPPPDLAALILAIILAVLLIPPIFTTAHANQDCSESFYLQASGRIRNITNCKQLNALGAEFGWSYQNDSSNSTTSTIEIYIGAKLESEVGWLAWGVNPLDTPRMVGTRALIGIRQHNGSLVVKTYNITWETKLGCRLQPSRIEVEVISVDFKYENSIGYHMIYAKLLLPPEYNITRLNHVWQVGDKSSGVEPLPHAKILLNFDGTETIDLTSGINRGLVAHRRRIRTIHGVLDIIGWGIFLPTGVIVARYCRKFPFKFKSWFRAHVGCQIMGYTLGTVGWSIGLWLGRSSKYYSFPIHGLIATFIFAFTTLQMLALQLKPKRTDDYRRYWNMYHHFLGYALLALISVNIFRGIRIFSPNHTWKWAYVGVLCVLASIALALEIYTWIKFLWPKWENNKNTAQANKKNNNNILPTAQKQDLANTASSTTSKKANAPS